MSTYQPIGCCILIHSSLEQSGFHKTILETKSKLYLHNLSLFHDVDWIMLDTVKLATTTYLLVLQAHWFQEISILILASSWAEQKVVSSKMLKIHVLYGMRKPLGKAFLDHSW
jgi:hypothetical protein